MIDELHKEPAPSKDSASTPHPRRIINPDGSVNMRRVGVRRRVSRDLYHVFRTASWPKLLGTTVGVWLATNLLFALLFLAGGDCIDGAEPGSFTDAFFFSVQTLSTIGYGVFSPATSYAHLLVSIEAFLGLILTAMTTGVVFARFATATAKVRFSNTAIIRKFDDRPVFMFRMVNERNNQIVEASLRVALIRDEVTPEGERIRRFHDLTLRRSSSPIFALGWTVFHDIDENSPLFGQTAQDLAAVSSILVVVFMGFDDALAETVHARYAYNYDEIVWDHRYVDMIRTDADGQRVMDYSVFDDTQPI